MDGDSKFQSTPPRRRRRSSCCRYLFSAQNFNPRLREGGDFAQNIIGCFHFNFNPRLREGGDVAEGLVYDMFSEISIHASAKEATGRNPLKPQKRLISIHASAKEATQFLYSFSNFFHFNLLFLVSVLISTQASAMVATVVLTEV